MNTYSGSDGKRYTQKQIDYFIRLCKQEKIRIFVEENGYPYCEECKRNDCVPIDCSHDISVQECKNRGTVELAWNIDNITLRGRPCHRRHDGL